MLFQHPRVALVSKPQDAAGGGFRFFPVTPASGDGAIAATAGPTTDAAFLGFFRGGGIGDPLESTLGPRMKDTYECITVGLGEEI